MVANCVSCDGRTPARPCSEPDETCSYVATPRNEPPELTICAHPDVTGSLGDRNVTERRRIPPEGIEIANEESTAVCAPLFGSVNAPFTTKGNPCRSESVRMPDTLEAPVFTSV